MFSKSLKTALAATIVLTSGAGGAVADNLGAALIGGLIGGAILNETNRKRRSSTSGNYSAARTQNRETQASLNYFGFPAGTPDGVMGRKSRAAISHYQGFMGFPTTGQLSPYERDFLVSSHSRAQIGGPQVIKAMQGPNGVRGLLHTWRDEAAGVRSAGYSGSGYAGMPPEVSEAIDEVAASSDPSAEQLLQRSGFIHLADLNGDGKNDYMIDTSVSGSSFWCGASHCSVMVFASTPQGYQRNDFMARDVTPASFSCHQGVCRMNESTQMASVAVPAVPSAPVQGGTIMAAAPTVAAAAAPLATAPVAPAQPLAGIQLFSAPAPSASALSLASHCSKLSLLTGSNGGYMTLASMTDPELALGEQFCLARSYAINSGEGMVANLGGVSQAQVDSQCDAFGPAVAPFLTKLGSVSSDALVSEVQKFVLQSNMSIEQLANTAGICMFSGYRRDNMEVALGAALIMVGIGQRPYGELVGHHLSQGFGVAKSSSQAQDWYTLAVSSLEAGAEPVFAPGQPERTSLIKAASAGLSGQGLIKPVPAAASGSALPTFSSD